jgi:hypothetical protein
VLGDHLGRIARELSWRWCPRVNHFLIRIGTSKGIDGIVDGIIVGLRRVGHNFSDRRRDWTTGLNWNWDQWERVFLALNGKGGVVVGDWSILRLSQRPGVIEKVPYPHKLLFVWMNLRPIDTFPSAIGDHEFCERQEPSDIEVFLQWCLESGQLFDGELLAEGGEEPRVYPPELRNAFRGLLLFVVGIEPVICT